MLASFPVVALVMAIYCHLAFEENSLAQNPEDLYRDRPLMMSLIACAFALAMTALLFVGISNLQKIFAPTMPQHRLTKSAR